jgi:hypothetical protein
VDYVFITEYHPHYIALAPALGKPNVSLPTVGKMRAGPPILYLRISLEEFSYLTKGLTILNKVLVITRFHIIVFVEG